MPQQGYCPSEDEMKAEMDAAGVSANHTPGPWELENSGSGIYDLIAGESGDWIATIHGGYAGDEADAALIASAPDLLAIVENVVHYGGVCEDTLTKARAAIALARKVLP